MIMQILNENEKTYTIHIFTCLLYLDNLPMQQLTYAGVLDRAYYFEISQTSK